MNLPVSWTNKYKQNWEESWKRVKAWWNCEETDRPLVFTSIPKPDKDHKGRLILPKNNVEAALYDLDIEVKQNNILYYLENNLFPAEAAPHAFCNFGNLLGLLCVQAGGKLIYTMENGTVWLEQTDDLFDKSLRLVSNQCRELDFTTNLIKSNHQKFGYDVVLGANPMIDPMTTLSLMRGTENFLIDLIEREDDVKRWLKKLGELHRIAISEFRKARAEVGRREDYNWTGAWAPGDMDAIQCDVSTMLSPEMFRKFALPEMEYEASFYDYTLWHLDGIEEFRHLDDICAIPNLHAIQFIDGKKQSPVQYIDVWKKILNHKKSLLFYCSSKYASDLVKELGCRGIAFNFYDVKSEEEMEKLLKSFK